MELLFLGTGTSMGVPVIGCDCPVCTSPDPRNRRNRSSVLIRHKDAHVLIDTAPELRQQALRFGLRRIDAVFLTHTHADHIFGFDDLRRFNHLQGKPIPVYGSPDTLGELQRIFAYCFRPQQPGGSKPEVELRPVEGPFRLGSLMCTPIPVWHGQMPVTGWRIGRVAYVTDASRIPDESLALLEDLDVLVLGALRFRPHPTHMSIGEALSVIADLKPRQAFLTHLSHDVDHARTDQDLPPAVHLAYDGLSVHVPDPEDGAP
ncbi:MAG: MBL fold metallo-hydrolase [Bacillota bacterium]|nr:MBL fold metallo-hydrolase [Bacillota bacterium]REJ37299.1 MAG: MBL fold metallo-hydrolase [Bacillota bacterium]